MESASTGGRRRVARLALSFYQVLRSIGLAIGSALAGTALATANGTTLPTIAGYRATGPTGIIILTIGLVASIALTCLRARATS